MVADLFSLLAQTASPKGKPGKGELRRALLQRGKPRKERKTAEALEREKRGKGWCGGWGRPLQSACADSFPEGGSRERANCAGRFYREASRERNERQPWRWIGQSGEKVGAAVGADLFSLLAQTASPKGEAEKAGTIPRRTGIKIDEVYTHIRLRIRGNRFRKAIL